VSNDAFPFMTWRDTSLDGVPVRVARVSFSGELAFEVNVNWWEAPAVWERLLEAGRPYGITPYGTETMHVLRAEKGYPIIGQDTDGTVTPQDLGMSWAVSKKKPDFIGKRSFSRAENQNPLRKQLVGLLPVDRVTRLPEGSQIVEFCDDDALPPPPVPMLGHVTSSYRSAELDRTFALALVKAGQSRIGETLHVPVDGSLVPVEVTGSVLVDPEGARRDG
jgi:sarcosine oxidase, subunit alpha